LSKGYSIVEIFVNIAYASLIKLFVRGVFNVDVNVNDKANLYSAMKLIRPIGALVAAIC